MTKIIVLHDRFSNEPIVIRTNAINVVRKVLDKTTDIAEEYSEIMIGSYFLSVKETIGTVITRIDNAGKEQE